MPTVDARVRGWNNEQCTSHKWVLKPYVDDDGNTCEDYDWDSKLRCELRTIDAKHDFCKTCNLTLEYP